MLFYNAEKFSPEVVQLSENRQDAQIPAYAWNCNALKVYTDCFPQILKPDKQTVNVKIRSNPLDNKRMNKSPFKKSSPTERLAANFRFSSNSIDNVSEW